MDVLVIGGTLYFGKVIVRKLLERGDNVTTYSRGNTQPEFWNDVSHITGDRTDYDGFVKNLKDKKFDAVIDNLAFAVEDTQATVRALRGNIGKYLVASTVSIYGGPGHALKWETVDKRGSRDDFLNEFVDLDGCAPMREEDVDFEKVAWVYRDDIDEYGQGKRQIERYWTRFPTSLRWQSGFQRRSARKTRRCASGGTCSGYWTDERSFYAMEAPTYFATASAMTWPRLL